MYALWGAAQFKIRVEHKKRLVLNILPWKLKKWNTGFVVEMYILKPYNPLFVFSRENIEKTMILYRSPARKSNMSDERKYGNKYMRRVQKSE